MCCLTSASMCTSLKTMMSATICSAIKGQRAYAAPSHREKKLWCEAADLILAQNQSECTQRARRWNRPSMTPKDERCCTWQARKQRASQHAAGIVPYSYFSVSLPTHQYKEYLNMIMARGTLQEMLSEKWTNHFFLYFFIRKYAEARLTLRLWCHSRPDVDHIWPSQKTV